MTEPYYLTPEAQKQLKNIMLVELGDKCPKCSGEAKGFVGTNSVSYIAQKGLHGAGERLKCESCGYVFDSCTYSCRAVL